MSKFFNAALSEGRLNIDPTQGLSPEAAGAVAAADALGEQAKAQILETPAEQLGERTPQATGSPEQIQRVREAELVTAPTEEGFTTLSPDQAEQEYVDQLQREERPRDVINTETGFLTIPVATLVTKKDKGADTVGNMVGDIARAEYALQESISPGRPSADPVAQLALKDLELEEYTGRKPGTGQIKAKKGAGGALYLATLISMQRLTGNTDPEKVAEIQVDQDLSQEDLEKTGIIMERGKLARMIGQELEQMVKPSNNIDQTTGESLGTGYSYTLSDKQQAAVGNMALTAFGQMGIVQDNTTPEGAKLPYATRTDITQDNRTDSTYELTPHGYQYLNDISPVLEAIAPGLTRPVSLTPMPKGHYVGEAATGQSSVTRTPLKGVSKPTNSMQKAAQVVGEMPNIVSPHKLPIVNMMMTHIDKATQEGQESPFAPLFSQGRKKYNKLLKKSRAESTFKQTAWWSEETGKWMGTNQAGETYVQSDPVQEVFNDEHPNPEHGVEYSSRVTKDLRKKNDPTEQAYDRTHDKFAQQVQRSEWEKAKKVQREAEKYKNQAFYYGSTFIGNSGRMMVSQTELNWQANKLARFLVDNPRPTSVTKGGARDDTFRYVVARAMMHNADRYTQKELVRRFDAAVGTIGPIADMVYRGSQVGGPEGAELMGQAIIEAQKESNKAVIADEWEGDGEWGFVLDALHEFGKYRATEDGKTFQTRVKAEADGINNGSSIQGMQFGDELILERAGVFINDETGEVVPEGNMREFVFDQLGEVLDGGGFTNNHDNIQAKKMWTAMKGDEDFIKKFIKIPLMTTIYGKPSNMHGDHARSFVADKSDALLGEGATNDDKADAARIITNMIDMGLQKALNRPLDHQRVIKQTAGWLFNIMNEIPQIEGPNGYVYQAGGVIFKDDEGATTRLAYKPLGAEGELTGGPTKQSEITVKRKEGSALASKKPQRKSEKPNIGNITRNQLAVSGTHNIDATIAQETLVESRERLGPTFWGQQVFDAFIGDVSSFETMLDVGNQKFLDVNRRYNLYEAEQKAFDESVSRFNKKVEEAGDGDWTVGPEGDYAGLYAFAKRMLSPRNSTRWKDYGDAVNTFGHYGYVMEAEGDSPTPKLTQYPEELKPKQVKALMEYVRKNFVTPRTKDANDQPVDGQPVDAAFTKAIRESIEGRQNFEKRYREQLVAGRQYN